MRSWVESSGSPDDPLAFIEVFVNTPLEVCMTRDPKGLYQQAIAGKIKNFTGISDPYEAPEKPDLELAGASYPPEALAKQVIELLVERKILS